MQNKKIQSSLEFLTTYGWALLVMLVFVATLYYFGVFSGGQYVPRQCYFGAGLACNSFKISGNESNLFVEFTGRNDLGYDIGFENRSVNLTVENIGKPGIQTYNGTCSPSVVKNGGTYTCIVAAAVSGSLPRLGSMQNAKLSVTYKNCESNPNYAFTGNCSSAQTHTVRGEITTQFETYISMSLCGNGECDDNFGETNSTCAQDCIPIVAPTPGCESLTAGCTGAPCAAGICNDTGTACACCGDSICNAILGENYTNCADCNPPAPPTCYEGGVVGACPCTIDVFGSYTINTSGLGPYSGTCITINGSANGSTLDCGVGKNITGISQSGFAISIIEASNIAVNNCQISNFSFGISSEASSSVTLSGNNLTSNHDGIHFEFGGTGNILTANNASLNLHNGITIIDANATLTGNIVRSNGYNGILSDGISETTLNGNTVCDHAAPFWFDIYCGPGSVTGSSVYDTNSSCGAGITKTSGCSAPPTEIDGCMLIEDPGFYKLNKSISFSGSICCINITSSNVSFNGDNYLVDGDKSAGSMAVCMEDVTNVTVENVGVSDAEYGIFADPSSAIFLRNNSAENSTKGIYLAQVTGSDLELNHVFNNSVGITLFESTDNDLVSNNASSNTLYGILLNYSSSGNRISWNRMDSNGLYGIWIDNGYPGVLFPSDSNTLTSNNAHYNGERNILLAGSGHIVESNNASNAWGSCINLYEGNNWQVTNNRVWSCRHSGLWLFNSSGNNVVTGNTAINQSTGAGVCGCILLVYTNDTQVVSNIIGETGTRCNQGIGIESSRGIELRSNQFLQDGSLTGIRIGSTPGLPASAIKIVGNTFESGITTGLWFDGNIVRLSDINITGNNFSGVGFAFFATNVSQLRVEGNNFTAGTTGLWLNNIDGVLVAENKFEMSSRNIYLNDTNNGNFVGNNLSLAEYGIIVNNSGSNNFTGNNISSNTKDGLHIISSDHIKLSGNIISSNGEYGTYASSSNNLTFEDYYGCSNTLSDLYCASTISHGSGIFNSNSGCNLTWTRACTPPDCAPNWVVSQCNCTLNKPGNYSLETNLLHDSLEQNCVSISSNGSNSVLDCKGHSITYSTGNFGTGIKVTANWTNITNCSVSDFQRGISLLDAYNNSISYITANSNWQGIVLEKSDYNNVTNNVAAFNDWQGIFATGTTGADYNNFTGNTIANNTQYGIYIPSGVGNSFTGNTVCSNPPPSGTGNINCGVAQTNGGGNICMPYPGTQCAGSIPCTASCSCGDGTCAGPGENYTNCPVDCAGWISGYVKNSTGGLPGISNALVNATDAPNSPTATTNGTGFYNMTVVAPGTWNVKASKNASYENSTQNILVTIRSGIEKNFTLALAPPACAPNWIVSSCGCSLDVPGSYTLIAGGLSCSGAGIIIQTAASGSILNCTGRTITGPGGTAYYGIYLNATTNVLVKNCTISSYGYGIYLSSSSNSNNLTSNSISTSGTWDMYCTTGLTNVVRASNTCGSTGGKRCSGCPTPPTCSASGAGSSNC